MRLPRFSQMRILRGHGSDLLAIVEPPLRRHVDRPAWLEAALDVVHLLEVLLEVLLLPPAAAAPGAEDAGGGGRAVALLRLLAGLGRGRALHLLVLHLEADGVLIVLVGLLGLGSLLLMVPRIEKHLVGLSHSSQS